MHFTEIRLTNFGQYNGEQVLDLHPCRNNDNVSEQPIILIGGKNGAGKTTLLEAVKLCLYGPAFLGTLHNRRSYEDYLTSRIHRQFGSPLHNNFAGITVSFVHTAEGTAHTFRVQRAWQRKKRGVEETLFVTRDGVALTLEQYPWWHQFLHDLLPPGLADLFFFDGEQIQALADDPDYAVLGQSIRSLLGFDLLDRLQADLNVYISRQQRTSEPGLEQQLAALHTEQASVEEDFGVAYRQLATINREIEQRQGKVEHEERLLAIEGGDIATRHDELKQRAETLHTEIRRYERAIEEEANGLFPFAVIPELCAGLYERLVVEEESAQWRMTRSLAETFQQEVLGRLVQDNRWLNGLVLEPTEQAQLVAGITQLLQSTADDIPGPPAADSEIRHDISNHDRQEMRAWMDQALTIVPRHVHELRTALEMAIHELADIEKLFITMPAEETVQPILQRLATLHQEIGALKERQATQEQQVRQFDLKREELKRKEQAIYLRMMRGDDPAYRVQLATRSQQALVKYEELLRREKIQELEQHIVTCFGRLSRKGNYIKRVTIDPKSFATTLFNQRGDMLPREQLSAGEKQIYAIAVLWALRLVSGRSLPIIVDTPLGRLDSDHRQRLIQHYFPHASHQVVLLSTDAEIDADLYADLMPAVARSYHLVYQSHEATTRITEGYFWKPEELAEQR
jgi:DNA sulfur modification protein DndD